MSRSASSFTKQKMSEPFHHNPTLKQVGTGSEINAIVFLMAFLVSDEQAV